MKNYINGLEIFSVLATANASYALSGIIYKNCDMLTSLTFVLVGIAFSIAYLRGVVDHIKRRENSVALVLAMIPFVLSWIAVAPAMNEIYLKSYVGETAVKQKTDTSELELELQRKKAEIDSVSLLSIEDTLYKFESNRDVFISQRSNYWHGLRSDWVAKRRDRTHRYWLAVLAYGKDRIGSGNMAILSLAKKDYNEKLKEVRYLSSKENLKSQKDKENRRLILLGELSVIKKKLEIARRSNDEITNTKSGASLSEDDFYLIMFAFGVFLEIFVTLASYWFRPKMTKEVREAVLRDAYSNTSIEEFILMVKDNPVIVKEIFPNIASHKLNIVQALIRSWDKAKRTEKHVAVFNLFVNPNTGDTYSFSSSFRKVRKELSDYGIDFKKNPAEYSTKNLIQAIEKL